MPSPRLARLPLLLLPLLSPVALAALSIPELPECQTVDVTDSAGAGRWNLEVYFQGDVEPAELVPCTGTRCSWRVDFPAGFVIGFCSELTGQCPTGYNVIAATPVTTNCVGENSGANTSYIQGRASGSINPSTSLGSTSSSSSGSSSSSSSSHTTSKPSSTSTRSSSSSSSPSSSGAAAGASSSSSHSSSNGGAIAGGVIGGLAAVAAFVAVAWALLRRRARAQHQYGEMAENGSASPGANFSRPYDRASTGIAPMIGERPGGHPMSPVGPGSPDAGYDSPVQRPGGWPQGQYSTVPAPPRSNSAHTQGMPTWGNSASGMREFGAGEGAGNRGSFVAPPRDDYPRYWVTH